MKKLLAVLVGISSIAYSNTILTGRLVTGVSCNVNGAVVAQLTKNVTIDNESIPAGTKILGTVNKCNVIWSQFVKSDGSELQLIPTSIISKTLTNLEPGSIVTINAKTPNIFKK